MMTKIFFIKQDIVMKNLLPMKIMFLIFFSCFFVKSALSQEKMIIAIMDFTSVDIEANRYLKHTDKVSIDINQDLLTPEERALFSGDELKELSKAEIKERLELRKKKSLREENTNDRQRMHKKKQRERLLSSKSGRGIILGAEMLAAELYKYGEVIELVDRHRLEESLTEMEFNRSGLVPSETAKQLGQMTGATHLAYGTVNDYRVEERKFSGYGVTTNNVVHSLDLTVKIIETATNKVVFVDEVTYDIKEMKTSMSSHNDTGLQKKLMKGAIKKVAKNIGEKFTPIQVAPVVVSLPKVLFDPKRPNEKSIDAELKIDGEYYGNTPATIEVNSGKHTVTISSDGFKVWEETINMRDGMKIAPKLKKLTD